MLLTRQNKIGIASGVNMLVFPQTIDNPAWVKTAGAITADATLAPDGTVTADKLIEDATTDFHSIRQNVVDPDALKNRALSFYLKQSTRTKARILIETGVGTNGVYADFDLAAGTTGGANLIGASTNIAAGITAAANGFYRCFVAATIPLGDANILATMRMLNAASAQNYAGDGVSGLFIWGGKLEAALVPSAYP